MLNVSLSMNETQAINILDNIFTKKSLLIPTRKALLTVEYQFSNCHHSSEAQMSLQEVEVFS